MIDLKIYDDDKRLDRAIARLRGSGISSKNKGLIQGFISDCNARNLSFSRQTKYIDHLRRLAEWLGRDLERASKKDLKEVVAHLNGMSYRARTKRDYKVALKVFYKWLFGSEEEEYPEQVRWIKTSLKRSERELPKLLSKDEIDRIFAAARNIRDKAMIALYLETGARPGELLNMRMGHVGFDEFSPFVLVKGKAGRRRLRVVEFAGYLKRWLEAHPFRDDAEAPLWMRLGADDKEDYLRYKSLERRIAAIKERSGVDFSAYRFRHTRLTELAKKLREAPLCKVAGWEIGSPMPRVYVHLSGEDADGELLSNVYGMKPPVSSDGKPKVCSICGEPNPRDATICWKCMRPLDPDRLRQGLGITEEIKDEIIERIVERLKERGVVKDRENTLALKT